MIDESILSQTADCYKELKNKIRNVPLAISSHWPNEGSEIAAKGQFVLKEKDFPIEKPSFRCLLYSHRQLRSGQFVRC